MTAHPHPTLGPAIASIALALAVAASPVQAQIKTPVGSLFPQVRYASDYRYDGFSNSDRRPSVQAGVYLWRPDQIYAGAEYAQVRFRGISTEVDLYGGGGFDVAGTHLAVEGMAVLFPSQPGPAPTYNFVQATLKARRQWGPLSLGATSSWSPQGSYHSGQFLKLAVEASYQATPSVVWSAKLGTRDSQRGHDRSFWDAGVTLTHANFAFDLRYAATNLTRAQCFYTERCAPGVIGKLTVSLPSKPSKTGATQ